MPRSFPLPLPSKTHVNIVNFVHPAAAPPIRRAGIALVAACLSVACAHDGPGPRATGPAAAGPADRGASDEKPAMDGDIALAFQRAGWWTGIKVEGNSLTGPRISATIKENEISGFIDGQGFSLDLEGTHGLGGLGTSGNIAADVQSVPGGLGVSGTWNGSRVRLAADQEKVEGTLPILGGGSLTTVYNCQYQLEDVAPNVYEGTSVCQGLPEQTHLEIDPKLWTLQPNKAAAILLILLQAPPRSVSEQVP